MAWDAAAVLRVRGCDDTALNNLSTVQVLRCLFDCSAASLIVCLSGCRSPWSLEEICSKTTSASAK